MDLAATAEIGFGIRIFRLLLVTGGVTLPLVHESGRFLDVVWLFISFLLIASATVRTIRWRRDYATSLRRLIRGGECR